MHHNYWAYALEPVSHNYWAFEQFILAQDGFPNLSLILCVHEWSKDPLIVKSSDLRALKFYLHEALTESRENSGQMEELEGLGD